METHINNIDSTISFLQEYKKISKLCDWKNDPQNKLKCIHIAGTNGKGSLAHILSAVLQTAGLKIGIYTSPHLLDFRERIRINNKKVNKEYVTAFVNEYRAEMENTGASFFELSVAMAFDYFASKDVDYAIIETGLGGRLDSTNIIMEPILSIITNIGLDHQFFLGDTHEKIAFEKAGIIKEKCPIVLGEFHPDTIDVFDKTSKKMNARLIKAYEQYLLIDVEQNDKYQSIWLKNQHNNSSDNINVKTDLLGPYQPKNIITALAAFEILRKEDKRFEEKHFFEGVQNVNSLSGFEGRWQIFDTKPRLILECGHNKDGLSAIIENIYKFNCTHIIFGCVVDKDHESIIDHLPRELTYLLCKPDVPRGLEEEKLFYLFEKKGFSNIFKFKSVKTAYAAANEKCNENSSILVTGSIFVVAECLSLVEGKCI
ncbi:MAG TPA: bifunctional folylpolyglutamate synthase/dihydrofolate synthase [Bacteroidetes bacterium]|nr:bifunctional folylpolyglutamate synthase/dihydrofolate synthase [Bacteroidota bacterium]